MTTLPNLRSLNINLHEEDQVDLVMRVLENLEFLNGLPVERENEEEGEDEQEDQDEKEFHGEDALVDLKENETTAPKITDQVRVS